MFLSREIDIKLRQNYTKTYIDKILYKSCSIKQIKIQQIRNQSENGDIQEEPEKLRFAPIIILILHF